MLTACFELYEALYSQHFMGLILGDGFYLLFNKDKETEAYYTDEQICSMSHR